MELGRKEKILGNPAEKGWSMADYSEAMKDYIDEEIRVMAQLDVAAISEAMNEVAAASDRGSMIYTLGNGGSASTASHIVNDFAKGVYEKTKMPLRFICLSDNVSTLTAVANDISYEDCYAFQLRDRVKKGDLLIAISGSGNSENVIRAVQYAKECGARIIGMTGYSGGRLKELSDVSLHVPINNMQIVEDLHMMFDHVMMYVMCQFKAR